MNRAFNKLKQIGFGGIVGLLACTHVSADDIEIYVGSPSGQVVLPNILFILDTSGSMSNPVPGAILAYDSTATYTPTDPYDSNFYYWSIDGSLPKSTSTVNKVHKDDFHCNAAATPLANNGIFTDRALNFLPDGPNPAASAWIQLKPYDAANRLVADCFTDNGTHGSNTGGGNYVSNGATGPWTGSDPGNIWKANNRLYYTFFTAHFLNYSKAPPAAPASGVSTGDPPEADSRSTAMISAVDELSRRLSNVRMGLMVFGSGDGGYIHKEIDDVNTVAKRQALLNSIATVKDPGGGTPLAESMFEAFRYYTGGAVEYGDGDAVFGATEGFSVPNSLASATTYKSPLQKECGKNYIVLLTDGGPTGDDTANGLIESLTGTSPCSPEGFGSGNCLDDIANYMDEDRAYITSGVNGDHRIQTYTIAFDLNSTAAVNLLKKTSKDNPPVDQRHFAANSAEGLISALANILRDITGDPSTFTAPSVSANAFNRLLNRDSLYYTMFIPRNRPRWDGNLKKYKLVIETNGNAYITDRLGTAPSGGAVSDGVVDDQGNFIDIATSFWSAGIDGNNVGQGGVRDRLDNSYTSPGNRRLYSDTTINGTTNAASMALVSTANSAITPALLGVGTTVEKDRIVNWMLGVDVLDADQDSNTTEPRNAIGDPLHAQPVIVNYGGSVTAPEQVIFFSTNDGYLHAIDEITGNEILAYLPAELLPLQKTLYDANPTIGRPYGLDGSPTVWTHDNDKDGIIEPADGDKVYLYFGMRRGGDSFYALDVTNLKQSTPSISLLWKIVNGNIVAGTAGSTTNAIGGARPYGRLGQTWAQPLLRKIQVGTDEKVVLVMSGGYDTNQDGVSVTTPDNFGNAVYFINAETGANEWWAGLSTSTADLKLTDMKYSIPSRMVALDITGDTLIDRMYVGDMGGQVWRFDVFNGKSKAELVKGGVIANLAGTDAANARRFYAPPDVALSVGSTGAFLSLVIGSGYRAHPLNDVIEDRLYMIKDNDIYTAPITYTAVTESDLYDATDNIVGEGTGATQATALQTLQGADGWFIKLGKGEKSLSAPLVLGGVAIMSTFSPSTADSCVPKGAGTGAVYYLGLSDATPVFNFDNVGSDDALTKTDRKYTLKAGGIPPDLSFIVGLDTAGEVATALFEGKEQLENPLRNRPQKTYWYEQ